MSSKSQGHPKQPRYQIKSKRIPNKIIHSSKGKLGRNENIPVQTRGEDEEIDDVLAINLLKNRSAPYKSHTGDQVCLCIVISI